MAERFSKQRVVAELVARRTAKEREFFAETRKHIDPGNGFAQLRGMSEDAHRTYGGWRALADLLEAVRGGEL